ncbi:uncharacterized protein LOC122197832 [Lactuca sativa]|uniref:uncharacterized protein LOC122197832 n=1 Tax=Lactuca sativa TaxID=4236 RepID=UPI001C692B11|nr:uncharacterized protein LOC122197832 [Lactuca sativa]
MLNGRNQIRFITIILSLTIILMVTMIGGCDGSFIAACNGSTVAECGQQVIEDEEQEFLMDTEEHRRILYGKIDRHLVGAAQKPHNPACKNNCSGDKKYNVNGRPCKTYDRCRS